MPPHDKSNRLIIDACRAGDADAWNRVQEISRQFLRRWNRCHPDDHPDITQNALLKLLNGFESFTGTTEGELRQFINVTTMREAVSHYRKNARHQAHESLDAPRNSEDPDQSFADLLPDSRLTPDNIAEINDVLRQASARLSIRDLRLLMYKAEGYKDREIAEMLGFKTVGGVAVTCNRIRELLRKTLLAITLLILYGRKLPWMTSL